MPTVEEGKIILWGYLFKNYVKCCFIRTMPICMFINYPLCILEGYVLRSAEVHTSILLALAVSGYCTFFQFNTSMAQACLFAQPNVCKELSV